MLIYIMYYVLIDEKKTLTFRDNREDSILFKFTEKLQVKKKKISTVSRFQKLEMNVTQMNSVVSSDLRAVVHMVILPSNFSCWRVKVVFVQFSDILCLRSCPPPPATFESL